jgi:hypothetical protein
MLVKLTAVLKKGNNLSVLLANIVKKGAQSGVFVGYSSSKGYGLLNGRLYMPESWFDDENEDRPKENWVPEELNFQTKLEITLDLINQAKNSGFYQAK